MSIHWVQYPKSAAPTKLSRSIVQVFEERDDAIGSSIHQLKSDEVLAELRPGLEQLGFLVERGKKKADKIHVPVLFGMNGAVEKAFEADAYHEGAGFVLEVEAGRGVVNNQFLKDLFQACMMNEVHHLAIAVRNLYQGGGRNSRDFERVVTFFDTLFASNRLDLPLAGILIIGY